MTSETYSQLPNEQVPQINKYSGYFSKFINEYTGINEYRQLTNAKQALIFLFGQETRLIGQCRQTGENKLI